MSPRRVENIRAIYCSVKFHQTAINQKLNLSGDAIFIVSQAQSHKKNRITAEKSFKSHKDEERQARNLWAAA